MQTGKCPAAIWLVAVVLFGLASCSSDKEENQLATTLPPIEPVSAKSVASTGDDPGARIIAAESEPGSWLTHGRTYSEQRFSPLNDIGVDNIEDLGLAWYFDIETNRGIEATPLIVDGVISAMFVFEHDNTVQKQNPPRAGTKLEVPPYTV